MFAGAASLPGTALLAGDGTTLPGLIMIRIAISFLLLTTALSAADYGPEKGTLVIVGGNMQDPAIVKRFIDLAGGPEAPIVIIPTAGEADDEYDQYWSGLRLWRENGAKKLTVLHTRDRKVADSEAFVKPIREARGVFFAGGRQWRLADSYLNTLTHKALTALLESRRRGRRIIGRRVDPDLVHGPRRHQEQREDDRRSHRGPWLPQECRRRSASAAPQPAVRHARSDRQAPGAARHRHRRRHRHHRAGGSVRRDREKLCRGLQQHACGGIERPVLLHGRG